MEQTIAARSGNAEDADYDAYLARVRTRFSVYANGQQLFTTDAGQALWDAYLKAFPDDERQHHNCNACHHFIRRYGALVTIGDDGLIAPVVWDVADAYGPYAEPTRAMSELVRRAKVTGVFVHAEQVLGHPQTGVWKHLHAHHLSVHRDPLVSASQKAAAKRQDFLNLRRGLSDFTPALVVQAVQLLESGTLYRGEKVLPMAKWVQELQGKLGGHSGKVWDNGVWLAAATAPAGFCQFRGSVLGTLLEDIKAGRPITEVVQRFDAKMAPDTYQRAQVAPKAGTIQQAEKAVEALGIAPAFARRYATDDDFLARAGAVWQPGLHAPVREEQPALSTGGVFGHLKPVAAATPDLAIPPKKVTWEKFAREVLPGAAEIHYRVPLVGRFAALTAAQDLAAPPILQWDAPDLRNTLSWSFPNPAARAEDWNLQAGQQARVRLIVKSPNQLTPGQFDRHGNGVFLLLDGAKDTRGQPGGGLFPEHLRSELKPYRAVIEAHMNKLMVAGADDPAAAFGIGLFAGVDFTETAAPAPIQAPAGGPTLAGAPDHIHVVLVLDDSGSMKSHLGSARKAIASLASSIRSLPGQVDVTVIRFGSEARTIMSRAHVHELEGIERTISGDSGGTALNDTLYDTIHQAMTWADAQQPGTAFFLGIVTDGKDEGSRRYSPHHVHSMVELAQATGRWTIAFAGAAAYGYDPAGYARSVGIPSGNVKVFEASARGFEDAGAAYAASTATLSQGYARGLRASTSFFAADAGSKALGTDNPVLIVTNKSGSKLAYALDRWD